MLEIEDGVEVLAGVTNIKITATAFSVVHITAVVQKPVNMSIYNKSIFTCDKQLFLLDSPLLMEI